jgi:hypothetical protein
MISENRITKACSRRPKCRSLHSQHFGRRLRHTLHIKKKENDVRILQLLLICVFISGCASGVQNMRKLDPGMSPAEVEQIMGKRDSFSTVEKGGDTYTLYQYTNQFCNAHVSLNEKCDFFVRNVTFLLSLKTTK